MNLGVFVLLIYCLLLCIIKIENKDFQNMMKLLNMIILMINLDYNLYDHDNIFVLYYKIFLILYFCLFDLMIQFLLNYLNLILFLIFWIILNILYNYNYQNNLYDSSHNLYLIIFYIFVGI